MLMYNIISPGGAQNAVDYTSIFISVSCNIIQYSKLMTIMQAYFSGLNAIFYNFLHTDISQVNKKCAKKCIGYYVGDLLLGNKKFLQF